MRKHQDKSDGDKGPQHVTSDHHLLAVKTIERDPGDRRGDDGGERARDHYPADSRAGPCNVQGKAQNGDAVEVVTDFANNLAQPDVTIVAVPVEQAPERHHLIRE